MKSYASFENFEKQINYALTVIEKRDNMKKTYTKRQIAEAIAYWEKQLRAGNCKKLDEASYEEGQSYRRSLEKEARYVVPAVQRAVKQNELPGTVKPVQGDWIDLLNAACAIAYYAQCNCPDKGLAEIAERIVQIGAGSMI